MKYGKPTLVPAILALLFGIGSATALVHTLDDAPPDLPEVATGVGDLLFARPFLLEEDYEHLWRAEAPRFRGGYLLVLEVDHPFTIPRNGLESVLYVGEQTAERVNWGTGSGRVVAIVPTPLDETGTPRLLLEQTPIWYGTPELPERIDAAAIRAELDAALARGIGPFPEEIVSTALERGGDRLTLPGRFELDRYTAQLIHEFSPTEAERADGMLAPLVE